MRIIIAIAVAGVTTLALAGCPSSSSSEPVCDQSVAGRTACDDVDNEVSRS
ncbi:hypothetical protein FB565_003208 [Actinoplanes lutulentus]|uniref:Lipoprotein n=1 Tax=Actinoplanes lutulentus TaxID=1287878 RepID=A0A327Z5L1_9ACTN|nr:hypothetical protein [Actinoplanes lutulentus]MBB2943495.1 hypothetical protein [Actinoplanes lutulentus]RAK25986.1 hypothetical protein B0I29_12920 [Actinoplanes lutulentus]